MDTYDVGRREILDDLIADAFAFLSSAGANSPDLGLKEAIDKVLRAKTSHRKIIVLNDLIEWIDGISAERAKQLREALTELKK